MKSFIKAMLILATGSLLLAGAAVGAPAEPVVNLEAGGSSVIWMIDEFDYGLAELTVVGPRKIAARITADRGETPKFTAVDASGLPVDGTYTWNLTVRSYLDRELLAQIAESRLEDNPAFICDLQDEGLLSAHSYTGVFQQVQGKVYLPTDEPEKSEASEKPLEIQTGDLQAGDRAEKQVITGNAIVYNSICVGFDCLNPESFGADTIRLKENNLRIHFDDTSTAASYPRNDWRITVNSSSNGGASMFAIDDVTGGRTPFTIRAGARSNALYVDAQGDVGFGTSTPVTELHAASGDTPTLRLEQNGSSGFSPQTWDVAGNETSFFIRDATNGSTLPFRIRPGASSQALVIDAESEIGIGLLNAEAALHIRRSDNTARIRVESTGEAGESEMARFMNDGKLAIRLDKTDTGDVWDFSNDGAFNISKVGTGVNEFRLNLNGDLLITGDLIAQGGDGTTDPGDTFPDYVFAPEYELMSIDALEEFVTANRHLPNVPSADDISAAGAINMTELQLRMLEKVEELTLYTISQERTMRSQEETIEAQAELIRQLTERLDALEAGLN